MVCTKTLLKIDIDIDMAELPPKKKDYEGEYKVEISDKGRIQFNLNWKWAVGIVVAVIGFIGYLLIDEYYIEPMADKDAKIEALETGAKSTKEILETLEEQQKILVDRSERWERFMENWIENQGGVIVSVPEIIPDGGPGHSEVPVE